MGTICDLTGQRFGRLTVLSKVDSQIAKGGRKKAAYLCVCDCGVKKVIRAESLRNGKTKSCGCLAKDTAKHSIRFAALACVEKKRKARDELIGKRFGKLTVIAQAGKCDYGPYQMLCCCDCGETVSVEISNLKRGVSTQCIKCRQKELNEKFRDNEIVDGTSLCHLTQKKRRDNSTGVKGVWFDKRSGKYVAEIRLSGKKHWIGQFSSIEDAKKARERAEEELFDPILESHNRATTSNLRALPD